MYQYFEQQKQWDFGIDLLKQLGYDFDAGRQDLSSHPFSIHFSPQDARVTTRIDENNLNEMIWSCIHEGGHALYEQGLLNENYGLPLGEAISLGYMSLNLDYGKIMSVEVYLIGKLISICLNHIFQNN